MYRMYLNQVAGVYLFLYFFSFHSVLFQNIKIVVTTSFLRTVRHSTLKLDIHMGNGYIKVKQQCMYLETKILHGQTLCRVFEQFFENCIAASVSTIFPY